MVIKTEQACGLLKRLGANKGYHNDSKLAELLGISETAWKRAKRSRADGGYWPARSYGRPYDHQYYISCALIEICGEYESPRGFVTEALTYLNGQEVETEELERIARSLPDFDQPGGADDNVADKDAIVERFCGCIADACIRVDPDLQALPQHDTVNGFNAEAYVKGLASMDYFSDLGYRGVDGGGQVDVAGFVERRLVHEGEVIPLARLLDFQGVRVKIFASNAGKGKTASLIALIRSFQDCSLAERLGFEPDDGLRDQVPFFFSFNPGRGLSRPRIAEGTYSEILNGLMHGDPGFPLGNGRDEVIGDLGRRAFFVLDSLDEAADVPMAINAIESLAEKFNQAGIVVSTRPLAQRLGCTPYGVKHEFFLQELGCDQVITLVERHLIDANPNLELDADALSECASELANNKYTSCMVATPLFASIAARKCEYDPRNKRFKKILPDSTFKSVIDALLGKSAVVLGPYLEDVEKKHRNRDGGAPALTALRRTQAIMRRLALASFLGSKEVQVQTLTCDDVAREARLAKRGEMDLDTVKKIMPLIAADLSFPEELIDGDVWAHYLIASGLVPCSPSRNGGTFSFGDRDMRAYLAAGALADLMIDEKRPKSDALMILRDLLAASCDEDVSRLAVMLLSCIDRGADGRGGVRPGDNVCEVLGDSLEVINCIFCEASEVDEDAGERVGHKLKALLGALKDIEEEGFGSTQVTRFRSGRTDGPQVYRELIAKEIEWLQKKTELLQSEAE